MKVESLIPASWFYTHESEKTKANWFAFEYACKLYGRIDGSRDAILSKWKALRGDGLTAEFCAYFAKRMGRSVCGHMDEDDDSVMEEYGYIRDYCHAATRSEGSAILEACIVALAELMESCVACPVRCLEEAGMGCEFFDRMERGEYFT